MPLHGIKELRKQFKDLKRSAGRNLSRRIARTGARIVRDEARATAPRKTGRGARGILAVEGRAEVRTDAVYRVGFRKSPKDKSAFYLRFIERGTKPHVISVTKTRGRRNKVTSQSKKALRTKAGEWLGIAVFHPGIKPRPFLVPALHNKKAEMLEFARHAVAVALSDGIQGHFSGEGGSSGTD